MATRATIRREIARRLNMDFALRVGESSTATGGGAAKLNLIDTSLLTQADDYWNGDWLYIAAVASGDTNVDKMRLITDSDQGNGAVDFLEPLGAQVASGDTYEIHSGWNAAQIHSAVNAAIEDGFPEFFDTNMDDSVIITRDTLEYTLPTGTPPYFVNRLWIEQPEEKAKGTASSGGATTLVDSSRSWTNDEWIGMTVAIYHGTGKGQHAVITGSSSNTLTHAAWLGTGTTSPDTTSKYVIKDTTREVRDHYRVTAARLDKVYYPTKLYLTIRYTRFEGYALRLQYVSKPSALTVEASSTDVPQEFIVRKALALLYAQRIADTRVDSDRFRYLQQYYDTLAEAYRQQNKWRMPSATMWTEAETAADLLPSDYPFSGSS